MFEFIALIMATAEPRHGEIASDGKAAAYVFPDPQRVEGTHLVATRDVVARFFRLNDPACFRVYFGVDSSGVGHQVDFVSKRMRVIIVEEGKARPVDPFARCGPSWT